MYVPDIKLKYAAVFFRAGPFNPCHPCAQSSLLILRSDSLFFLQLFAELLQGSSHIFPQGGFQLVLLPVGIGKFQSMCM